MKMQVSPARLLREEALRLFKEGKDINQIAQILHLPIGKIYYWRRYYLNPPHIQDGRRLYDDQFKQDVLDRIAGGTSVSYLARSLGVSKVTLFKWKREWRHQAKNEAGEGQEAPIPTATNSPDEQTEENLLFPAGTIEDLLGRIHVLEEEKAALMKTLQIFMRRAEWSVYC